MSKEQAFTSIAEALAAAQKASPKRSSGASPYFRGRAATPSPVRAPAARAADDLRDEFDYAIEAVETARKALPRDSAAATTMAVNIVMAKCKKRQAEAADLVQRAVRYLDR